MDNQSFAFFLNLLVFTSILRNLASKYAETMIQRVQTVLLGLVAIFHILLFFIPIFTWNVPVQAGEEWWSINATYNIPFIVVNTIIILLSVFIILQFKNRKKQRSFTFILMGIIILNVCLYLFYLYTLTASNNLIFLPARSFGIYMSIISVLLCYFAARRIKKDDDLVKSIDRIR